MFESKESENNRTYRIYNLFPTVGGFARFEDLLALPYGKMQQTSVNSTRSMLVSSTVCWLRHLTYPLLILPKAMVVEPMLGPGQSLHKHKHLQHQNVFCPLVHPFKHDYKAIIWELLVTHGPALGMTAVSDLCHPSQ